MSYALNVPNAVRHQVRCYLKEQVADPDNEWVAMVEITSELAKLAANPRLGTSPPGLFEGRPVYQFTLSTFRGDGLRRIAQVAYRVIDDAVELTGFEIVGLTQG